MNFLILPTNLWARNQNVDYTYYSSDDFIPKLSTVKSGMDTLYERICKEKHSRNGSWEKITINELHETQLNTASEWRDRWTSKFWLGTSGSGTGAYSGSFDCCNKMGVVLAIKNINVNWLWVDTIDSRFSRGGDVGFSELENTMWVLEQLPLNDVPFDFEVGFNDNRP
jgi:hypothetical protein